MRGQLTSNWMSFQQDLDSNTPSSTRPGSYAVRSGIHLIATPAGGDSFDAQFSDTQDGIRDITMELSDLPISPPLPSSYIAQRQSPSIHRHVLSHTPSHLSLAVSHSPTSRGKSRQRQVDYFDLSGPDHLFRSSPGSRLNRSSSGSVLARSSFTAQPLSPIYGPTSTGGPTSIAPPNRTGGTGTLPLINQQPSGLSLLLASRGVSPSRPLTEPTTSEDPQPSASTESPEVQSTSSPEMSPQNIENFTNTPKRHYPISESTPLLHQPDDPLPPTNGHNLPFSHSFPDGSFFSLMPSFTQRTQHMLFKLATKEAFSHGLTAVLQALPAVMLGLLLNILDGVSYGMILFPAGQIFEGFGAMGVSMFFVTTIISQLVYSCGSHFAGANGSMMIEVVPFFHILVSKIIEDVGEENVETIIATTLAAFTLSSFLTGITFWALGKWNLGVIIGFFPRHILVGCIGGVGVFLIETGLEVSAGLNEEGGFQYTYETFKLFFMNPHVLSLWLPALGLAVLLRVITHYWRNSLVFPAYFMIIPVIFYIVVGIAGLDLATLRKEGWLFDIGTEREPWYKIYSYYDFNRTSFSTLLVTMPTQFALLFFNILHPPLNVPALAVSLDQDVDTNNELILHGYSNLIAAFTGNVANYLVYVNTLLFYKVGGGTRVAGFLLALGTSVLLFIGTEPIGYMPVLLVGALIFVLGIDLVKEALWDTRHRVSMSEYITIVAIMICMTFWDFVVGVLFGIVLACFFFVVQNSQNRSVRAEYTGESTLSTVRRPSAHRQYLREVARQTAIMKLQSYLFFGTINYVEDRVRDLLNTASWNRNPIRFLIMDLSLVLGVDLSAAEAFVRLQRLLSSKGVSFILCGFPLESKVGKALNSVDLFGGENVELFANINEAMEWTENAFLRAWFLSQKAEQEQTVDHYALTVNQPKKQFLIGDSFENSPRISHLHSVGGRLMAPAMLTVTSPSLGPEPLPTILKVFSGYEPGLDANFFSPVLPYLNRVPLPEGHVLWNQGDIPDGLYIISSGVMRATYTWDNAAAVTESMVSGTLAGELSALSGLPRNATVVAERQSVLWKLSLQDLEKFETEHPEAARKFVKLVLRVAKNDFDVLVSACSRL